MNLLAFEFKKVFFSKKFGYLMLLLVIGVALLFIRNLTFQTYIEKDAQQQIDTQTRTSQANNRSYNLMLERDPDDENIKKLQLMNREIMDRLYDLAKVPTAEWENHLMLQNEIYENTIQFKQEGGENQLTIKEMNEHIALNEKLLSMSIPPEHATYSIALPNFMKQMVDMFIHFGAVIIMLLIIGEMLSGEFEQHSINLLFTQPLKKTSIVLSKFWSAVLLYIVMLGVFLSGSFIIGLFFGESGSFNYPLIMEQNNAIAFISVGDYIMKGILITSVMMLLVIALYLLYSLMFKHTLATLAALLGTFLGGYVLSAFITWGTFSWFNPFLNLLPGEMILNENEHIWYQAMPITLLLAVLIYWLARRKVITSKIN